MNTHLVDCTLSLGSYQVSAVTALDFLKTKNAVARIWDKDPTLWKIHDALHQASIAHRLGWLTSMGLLRPEVGGVMDWAQSVRDAGFTHAVVLGMGGSSLCPDVCRHTFSRPSGWPELLVLDNTNPAAVAGVESYVRLDTTLFLVSSKSGTTIESNVFYQYFAERLRARKGSRYGENFVAITDAGTYLLDLANKENFRKAFINPSDIGGRYSAHSYFGWVPAAVMGVDVSRLIERGQAMAARCRPDVPVDENPGMLLGVVLGALARAGRDKLTLVPAPEIATFGYWLEQLVAESTGKEGKGIVPIAGETPDPARRYGADRIFVSLQIGPRPPEREEEWMQAVTRAGHPVVRLRLNDVYDLGAEFFRWEFATAVAGAVMGINPFDEPNVKESKDNTLQVLDAYRATGHLPTHAPLVSDGPLSLICDSAAADGLRASGVPATLAGYLAAHVQRAQANDYLAIMAYLDQNSANETALQAIRSVLGARARVATTLGYGPRFLHSTGQLHKGGAGNGVFLQITSDNPIDLPIPGQPFSFGVLKDAQALGDYQALSGRGFRIVRVHIAGDVAESLGRLAELAKATSA